jgi:hypothetical protein
MAGKTVASEDGSQASKLYWTIGVLMTLLVLTTALRIWSKRVHRGGLQVDDWFILLGTAFNIIANGFELHAVNAGFGRHSHFIRLPALVTALKYMQLGVVMATLAILSIKISVCFFLLALVRDAHDRFRIFLWSLMAFTTLTSFIGLLLWGLQARPIERLWDPRVKGTRRSSEDFLNVVYVFYAFNAFTDLVYSLSPVWFLWNIQITKKKKYSIWAMMGSGIVLTGVVCVCIAFAPSFLETEDITWALVPIFISDCTQRHLSGIIANIPSVYTLISRYTSTPPLSAHSSGGTIGSKSKSGWRSISRKTNIQISGHRRESANMSADGMDFGNTGLGGRDPYGFAFHSVSVGTEDNIPLKERGVDMGKRLNDSGMKL